MRTQSTVTFEDPPRLGRHDIIGLSDRDGRPTLFQGTQRIFVDPSESTTRYSRADVTEEDFDVERDRAYDGYELHDRRLEDEDAEFVTWRSFPDHDTDGSAPFVPRRRFAASYDPYGTADNEMNTDSGDDDDEVGIEIPMPASARGPAEFEGSDARRANYGEWEHPATGETGAHLHPMDDPYFGGPAEDEDLARRVSRRGPGASDLPDLGAGSMWPQTEEERGAYMEAENARAETRKKKTRIAIEFPEGSDRRPGRRLPRGAGARARSPARPAAARPAAARPAAARPAAARGGGRNRYMNPERYERERMEKLRERTTAKGPKKYMSSIQAAEEIQRRRTKFGLSRCEGTTKEGDRCKRQAKGRFCYQHGGP